MGFYEGLYEQVSEFGFYGTKEEIGWKWQGVGSLEVCEWRLLRMVERC